MKTKKIIKLILIFTVLLIVLIPAGFAQTSDPPCEKNCGDGTNPGRQGEAILAPGYTGEAEAEGGAEYSVGATMWCRVFYICEDPPPQPTTVE